MTGVNLEAGELRVVEHLISNVRDGLSGRSGEELVDADPLRSIFAGVLQAPRQSDEDAASRGVVSGQAPTGTALGLDFKLRPKAPGSTATLSVKLSWAHYYPVFPTFSQTRAANEAVPGSHEPTEDKEEAARDDLQSPGSSESVEDLDEQDVSIDDGQDEPDVEALATRSEGKVILPRVWRRVPVSVDLPPVVVNLGARSKVTPGATAIAAQLEIARRAVASDPDVWHHLGEPKQRQRALGDAATLAAPDAFKAALDKKRGNPVAPPDWRAQLQIQWEPVVGEEESWRVRVLFANTTSEAAWDEGDPNLEQRALFDAAVEVRVEDAALEPFDFVLAPKDYRSDSTMPAKGINCSAVLVQASPVELRTETLPIFAQPLYRTREGLSIRFADLQGSTSVATLVNVGDAMRSYSDDWGTFLNSDDARRMTHAEYDACTADKEAFDREIVGFLLGVECLRRDKSLLPRVLSDESGF